MKKERILSFLKSAARFSEEIFVFLVGGSSYQGLSGGLREVSQLRHKQGWQNADSNKELEQERKRVYRLIQMLKNDGLIASHKKSGRLVQYQITQAGRAWLGENKSGDALPHDIYSKERSETATIVTYDIPQAKRRLRDWLRGELVALGLTMLQRSVFVGNVKMPEAFIKDLSRMQLINHVEIFEITKHGTLKSRK